ncbi:LtfC-like domain-containing protein [Rhodococcus triatomae]
MPDIGLPTPMGKLNLPTVGDFVYTYEYSDGRLFAEDAELYFLLGDPDEPQVQWDFVISGAVASIKKESTDVADIEPGTKFWLMYRDGSTTPTTEDELLTGTVKKVNA